MDRPQYKFKKIEMVTEASGMPNGTEFGTDSTLKIDEINKNGKENFNEVKVRQYFEVFIAEILATSLLLFFGCMSCITGFEGTQISDFHSAVSFGLVVMILISIFGHISAAHMNPSVSVTFYILGHITLPMLINYIVAELIGAVIGFGLLKLLTPEELFGPNLCTTVPASNLSSLQAFGIEFFSTSILLLLVCGLSDSKNAARQDSLPLKFGGVIVMVSLAAGKYTGASMSPARSFAPALWTGTWTSHWVYWLGPLSAAVLVPLFYMNCFVLDKS